MASPSRHSTNTPLELGAPAISRAVKGKTSRGKVMLAAILSLEATARVEARGVAQLLVELLLLLGERGRHYDGEQRVQIACAAAGLRQSLAGEAQLLPALR